MSSEDFGSYLKHERELRGISLDEIARHTKISLRFLRALEESRWEDLPGEVFIRGFIRSYGQVIGSNPEDLLAAYHEKSGPREENFSPDAEDLREQPGAKGWDSPALKLGLGFGLALAVIGGGVYWFTTGRDAPPAENSPTAQVTSPPQASEEVNGDRLPEVAETTDTAPADAGPPPGEPAAGTGAAGETPGTLKNTEAPPAPAGETPKPQNSIKNTVTVPEKNDIIKDLQDQTVPKPAESSSATAMAEQSLRLVIRVTENSWFNLTVDDQRDQDFILPADGSKTIEAKNAIVMTIGNRRATQLILNDQFLDLPESPDNVIRNFTVNAERLN